jgi:hypothetical protein
MKDSYLDFLVTNGLITRNYYRELKRAKKQLRQGTQP